MKFNKSNKKIINKTKFFFTFGGELKNLIYFLRNSII